MTEENKRVPLVVYVDGQRRVVGQAWYTGEEFAAQIDATSGIEVIDMLREGVVNKMSFKPNDYEQALDRFRFPLAEPGETDLKLNYIQRFGSKDSVTIHESRSSIPQGIKQTPNVSLEPAGSRI